MTTNNYRNMTRRTILSLALALCCLGAAAQESTEITKEKAEVKSGEDPTFSDAVQRNIDQWQDLKFGMFIHWGTYSILGVIESWTLCPEDVSWMRRPKDMSYFEYVEMYEHLKDVFYPARFNPDVWAEAAKYAGMKYVVFTTKHHDGFNMFGTEQTDYSVTDKGCRFSTSKKANIAKEVFNAFRAQGIQTGAYYSIADWHSDDFWWKHLPPKSKGINYDPAKHPDKWERYNKFMQAQIGELTDGTYGDLNLLWFDLCKCSDQYDAPVDWEGIARTARKNQPGIMLVARHTDSPYENYMTPEQTVPEEAIGQPWESCITMSEYSWSYRPEVPFKTTREMLDILVKVVSRGGNLLLNVGPKPDGTLQEEALRGLREIGDWMQVNSEGIYGTRAVVPCQEDKVYFTGKDGFVYAMYMADKDEKEVPEYVDIRSFTPESAGAVTLLGYNGKVSWKKIDGGIRVTIPKSFRKSPACDHIWTLKIKVK